MDEENYEGGNEEEQKLLDKKDDEDEDKEPGCCFHYGRCILVTVQSIYGCIKAVIMAIAECLGLCWYPFKERTTECCDCCGKRMNPHTDPAYGGF